jgi:cobalamin biosynthesis Mg chelatase CobN
MAEWSFTFATVAIDFEVAAYEAATATSVALPEVDAVNGPLRDLVEGARTQAELDAAVVAATGQQAAAEAIAAARTALAEPLDGLEEIGLSGTDLQPTLAEGIAAVAALDNEKAMAAAARIESTLAGASQQGMLRVATVVAIVLVLVALAVGLLVWFRRRRRGASGAAPGVEVGEP